MRQTKKSYEEYLNENSPQQGSSQWIIGGTIRMVHMWQNKYGTSTRKYNPIGFELGYNEWKRKQEKK